MAPLKKKKKKKQDVTNIPTTHSLCGLSREDPKYIRCKKKCVNP